MSSPKAPMTPRSPSAPRSPDGKRIALENLAPAQQQAELQRREIERRKYRFLDANGQRLTYLNKNNQQKPIKFNNVLDGLWAVMKTVRSFDKRLGNSRSTHLEISLNGQLMKVDRQSLSKIFKALHSEFKGLNGYFVAAKKRGDGEKKKVASLAGIYAPVIAPVNGALQQFLAGAQFTDASRQPALANLPQARAGLLLRNTLTLLMYLYMDSNGLTDQTNHSYVRSDDLMLRTFGGVPALYAQGFANGKRTKVGNVQNLSTYAILTQLYNGTGGALDKNGRNPKLFQPQLFKTFLFQVIAGLNYVAAKQELTTAAGIAGLGLGLTQAQQQDIAGKAAFVQQAMASVNANAAAIKAGTPFTPNAEHGALVAEHDAVAAVSGTWKALKKAQKKAAKDAARAARGAAF